MSRGFSFESFAGTKGISKKTLYNMAQANPSFLQAKEKGVEMSRHFWENIGIEAVQGRVPFFNAATWIFNMKNRFSWRDKHEIDISLPKPTIIERLNGNTVELNMLEAEVMNDDDKNPHRN